jgi:hypothetical protein
MSTGAPHIYGRAACLRARVSPGPGELCGDECAGDQDDGRSDVQGAGGAMGESVEDGGAVACVCGEGGWNGVRRGAVVPDGDGQVGDERRGEKSPDDGDTQCASELAGRRLQSGAYAGLVVREGSGDLGGQAR